MSYKESTYVSKKPNEKGIVPYTEEENQIWNELITRQRPIVEKYACEEYLHGLDLLSLPQDRVPQCFEISSVLQKTTGWALEPVPALIPFEEFFTLLANKKFPAATFIRRREDLDYLQEPDIFHETFGHCPLLTNPAYAEFTNLYGKLALKVSPQERVLLARLYWFTIEFGLIKTKHGLRAYGGGILSSKNETIYCIDSKIPERRSFDVINALRTPYRIDIMQPIYFVLNEFETLYHLTQMDLVKLIHEAKEMGEFAPSWPA